MNRMKRQGYFIICRVRIAHSLRIAHPTELIWISAKCLRLLVSPVGFFWLLTLLRRVS